MYIVCHICTLCCAEHLSYLYNLLCILYVISVHSVVQNICPIYIICIDYLWQTRPGRYLTLYHKNSSYLVNPPPSPSSLLALRSMEYNGERIDPARPTIWYNMLSRRYFISLLTAWCTNRVHVFRIGYCIHYTGNKLGWITPNNHTFWDKKGNTNVFFLSYKKSVLFDMV